MFVQSASGGGAVRLVPSTYLPREASDFCLLLYSTAPLEIDAPDDGPEGWRVLGDHHHQHGRLVSSRPTRHRRGRPCEGDAGRPRALPAPPPLFSRLEGCYLHARLAPSVLALQRLAPASRQGAGVGAAAAAAAAAAGGDSPSGQVRPLMRKALSDKTGWESTARQARSRLEASARASAT